MRKRIANTLGAQPSEIFFTRAEQRPIIWRCFVASEILVQRIISTEIEHHAVGHPIEFMAERGEVEAVYLD